MSNQNCTPCQNAEQERSLMNIGIASFVVVELTEYLDTHPHDREALNYFNYYNRMLNKMSAEFAAKFYPLNLATAILLTRNGNGAWRLFHGKGCEA